MSKLPDKGKKIQDLYERAVAALELKNEVDAAASLLTRLNINDIEWNEKTKQRPNVLDSDDDEDPIAILVSSNTASQNKRIVKNEVQDANQLISEEDIREAQEITEGGLKLDPVLEHVCQNENLVPAYRFLPYKSTANSLHSSTSSLDSLKKNKKQRDNSSATPPVHTQGVLLLPLRESIEIEHKQRQKMKEIQEKQAVDRLAIKMKELGHLDPSTIGSAKPEASFMSKYRLTSSMEEEEPEDSQSEEEDEG